MILGMRTAFSRAAASLVIAFLLALGLPQDALALESEPYLGEADAAIVCDQAGNVLWESNAYEVMAPASITKVMTAMVALDEWGSDLDVPCTVYDVSLPSDAQFAGYVAGDTPTRRELLQAMLVYSANEAASNIAINVSGGEQEFCERMNQKAAELGMSSTHFANPHGLEVDGHYSSARDLMVMGRHALLNYPFIAQTVLMEGVEAYPGGSYSWLRSTDDMKLWYDGLLGIKTGAVASGTTFLGASTRGGVALFTCVLGCDTDDGRFLDTASLMDWAYDLYWRPAPPFAGCEITTGPASLLPAFRRAHTVPWDLGYMLWPEGEAFSVRATMPHGLMTRADDLMESTYWRQDWRLCGNTFVWNDGQMQRQPAVNPFALPLFADEGTS